MNKVIVMPEGSAFPADKVAVENVTSDTCVKCAGLLNGTLCAHECFEKAW